MRKILFLALIFILCSQGVVFAEKITILYTGHTHAALYPCSCPKRPYGGVARRATVIKESRGKDPDVLFFDAGSFFGGGVYDADKIGIDLDKKRTLVNIKAMEMMGYDAVGLGTEELNFGIEFLEDLIKDTKINFLACNATLKGALPFIIKKVKGVRIGILAAMPELQVLEPALDIVDPLASLKDNIEELKNKKVDLVILLSQFPEEVITRLIQEGLDVDIVISAARTSKKELFKNINSTVLLRTSWVGRYVRRFQFEFKDGKIVEATKASSEIPLSGKIPDDPDIASIVPRCFADRNCKKPGLAGTCKKPATADAKCVFSEHVNIPLLIIEPESCQVCNVKKAVSVLKSYLPGIRPTYLKDNNKKAKDIIKKFDAKMLPIYLLDKKANEEKSFKYLVEQGIAELKHGKYVVNSSFIGASYFVGRKFIKNKIDMFIDLNADNAKHALSTIKQLLRDMKGKIDFDLHFLAMEKDEEFLTEGGLPLIEEYKRNACIMKHYQADYLDYILCRVDNIKSSWWEDCIARKNWDEELIRSCSRSEEATNLLRDNIKITNELGVGYGPLVLVNNQEIFGVTNKTSVSELKKIILPEEKE